MKKKQAWLQSIIIHNLNDYLDYNATIKLKVLEKILFKCFWNLMEFIHLLLLCPLKSIKSLHHQSLNCFWKLLDGLKNSDMRYSEHITEPLIGLRLLREKSPYRTE